MQFWWTGKMCPVYGACFPTRHAWIKSLADKNYTNVSEKWLCQFVDKSVRNTKIQCFLQNMQK